MKCAICDKSSIVRGKRKLLRGHYNPTVKSRKYPNLQWARVNGERLQICTNCLRTLHKKPTKTVAAV